MVDMAKSIQVLFRDARSAIEAAVRADLAQHGFGHVTPTQSALLRNLGDEGLAPASSPHTPMSRAKPSPSSSTSSSSSISYAATQTPTTGAA